jgi:hypothetical protein
LPRRRRTGEWPCWKGGLHALGKPPDSIVSLILGTTTTTNAAVQHKGAAGDPRQRDLELITRDIADGL